MAAASDIIRHDLSPIPERDAETPNIVPDYAPYAAIIQARWRGYIARKRFPEFHTLLRKLVQHRAAQQKIAVLDRDLQVLMATLHTLRVQDMEIRNEARRICHSLPLPSEELIERLKM